MAAHTPFLAKEVFATVDGLPLYVAANQDHVGGMAVLATGLRIFFGKQRPQPVLVVSVRFLDARSSPTISLVARRAAEFLGIVNRQQLRLVMTAECVGILIRLLLVFRSHGGRSDFYRLTRVHVTGFAPVHNVGVGNINLQNRGIPLGGLFFF